jgi:septal ring-binding cell division protein DamX
MRFEIGAGGLLLILIGLAGLSGSVFVFGMFAGYEVARQDQPNAGLAMVYPLPSTPLASSSAVPSPALNPSAAATAAPVAAAGALPAPTTRSGLLPPVIASPPESVSAVTPSPLPEGPTSPAPERPGTIASPAAAPTPATKLSAAKPVERESPRPTASAARVGPYSIEIQAVMDGQAALQLVNKLRRLGYQAYSVETEIDGRTWYKVRVGHFSSRAEAQAAEERLHQQFSGSLTTR